MIEIYLNQNKPYTNCQLITAMNENLLLILEGLLIRNKIKVNQEELRLQLFGHPTYPSLNSLTGVLDHFKIPNMALEVPKSEENIQYLPESFIAHINKPSGESFALIWKDNDGLMCTENGKNIEFIDSNHFLDIWSGIILGIDAEEYEVPPKKFNLKQFLIIISPIVLILFFFSLNQNVYQNLHFGLSLLGIYVCGLIFQHELGKSSPILDKICSGESKKLSCSDVMNSKGGKIFGAVKLSDLGMIYFLVTVILSIAISLKGDNFTLLYQMSLIALPFTIYSLYYQNFIVKKWCLLCLTTVGILILQAGISYLNYNQLGYLQFPYTKIPLLLFVLYLTVTSWFYISEKIGKNKSLLDLQINYNKFKRNFEIFNTLFSEKPRINTKIHQLDEITFGKANSLLEIVIITNPLCGFCKNAHKIIHQTLNYTNEVRIIVRFNLSNHKDRMDTQIATRLLEIFRSKGESACLKAMDDAYNNLTPQKWIETYGKCNNINIYDVLEKEKEWCTENQIHFTPAVYLNGKEYPTEYDFEDLQYFIDPLLEEKHSMVSDEILIQ